MKTNIAKLMTMALCAGCLVLSACGGASSSQTASSSAVEEVKVDPSEKFVGDWKLAAMKSQGITMAGDLSMISDGATDTGITVKSDGTGAFTFAGDKKDITWKQKDDNTLTLEIKDASNSSSASVELKSADGALELEMSDEEFSGTLIFTADGTAKDVKEIKFDKGAAVTSESELVGTWKLSGMNMMGMSMYGDATSLASMSGQDEDAASMTLESGGKGTIMGQSCTWSVGSDGATISMSGISLNVKALGDELMLDVSSVLGALGGEGVEVVYLYSK